MLGIKRKKVISYLLTTSIYIIMFLFILFNLPESAYAEDKDGKPEININIKVNKGGKNEINKSIEFNGNTEPIINININKNFNNEDENDDDDESEEEDNEDGDDYEDNNNESNNGGNAGDIDGTNNSGENKNQDNNEIQNNNIDENKDTENNDAENNEDENEDEENSENNNNNENGDEGNNEYINNDGDESYNNNEENDNNEYNGKENTGLNNEAYRYIKFVSEAISLFNEDSPGRNNAQKLNYIKFGSSLSNPGRESVSSSKKHQEPLKEINLLAFKSLNTKKEKINQELGIIVNGAGDILNLYNIIERYRIIKVINFDEIIDIDYKKDITPNNESEWSYNLPEFISTFWNNIKSMAALYN